MTSRGFNHGSPWLKPREVMNGGCGVRKPGRAVAASAVVPMAEALAALRKNLLELGLAKDGVPGTAPAGGSRCRVG